MAAVQRYAEIVDLIIKLDDIMNAIKENLPDQFDIVLGIERGGVLPAYLASRWLNIPFTSMRIRFRDEAHLPISAYTPTH